MENVEVEGLGPWLRVAMNARQPDMTLGELAAYSGVGKSVLSQILRNPDYRPTDKTIRKLAVYFDRPFEDVWTRANSRPRVSAKAAARSALGYDPRLLTLPAGIVDWIRDLELQGVPVESIADALRMAETYVRASQIGAPRTVNPPAPSDPSNRRRGASVREDLPDSPSDHLGRPPQGGGRGPGEVSSSGI